MAKVHLGVAGRGGWINACWSGDEYTTHADAVTCGNCRRTRAFKKAEAEQAHLAEYAGKPPTRRQSVTAKYV